METEFESIRFAVERDSEISLKKNDIAMRNMYANRVARGDGSTFLRGKERESAMMASSGFKGGRVYCNTSGHKTAQCFKTLCKSGGGPLPSRDSERSWCSLHNTHLHYNANCRVQQQQRGNGGSSGNIRGNYDLGNGNRRRHGSGSNTGRANTGVAVNGTSSLTINAPVPAVPFTVASCSVTAPPASIPAPPAPVASQVPPTPYVLESPPSGVGYPFLAGSAAPGPLKFTMALDFGA